MSKENHIRFSIVIPCYNEAAFVAETLDSIKQQDFQGGYEVVVVDNNSNDETAAIAIAMGAKVVMEPNRGVCRARQAGTEVAAGEIIISTDADTTFSSDWLSNVDKLFKKHPDAVAVGGTCHYKDGPLWGRTYTHVLFGMVQLIYNTTGYLAYASATNIAFKKSAWTGYDINLTQGGDEVGLLQKLRKNGKLVFTNTNATHTSGRRLQKGFIYNFFVTFLFYYFLEYNISRVFKIKLIGAAPAYRDKNIQTTPLYTRSIFAGVAVLSIIMLGLPQPRHHVANFSYKVIDKIVEEVTHRDLI